MSTAKYQRIPSSPPSRSSLDTRLKTRRSSSLESPTSPAASSVTLFDDEDASERGSIRHLPAYDSDPRFRQPTPSPYARAALLIFIIVMFIIAFSMRADVFYNALAEEEKRIQEKNEKWAEWAGAQDSY